MREREARIIEEEEHQHHPPSSLSVAQCTNTHIIMMFVRRPVSINGMSIYLLYAVTKSKRALLLQSVEVKCV